MFLARDGERSGRRASPLHCATALQTHQPPPTTTTALPTTASLLGGIQCQRGPHGFLAAGLRESGGGLKKKKKKKKTSEGTAAIVKNVWDQAERRRATAGMRQWTREVDFTSARMKSTPSLPLPLLNKKSTKYSQMPHSGKSDQNRPPAPSVSD